MQSSLVTALIPVFLLASEDEAQRVQREAPAIELAPCAGAPARFRGRALARDGRPIAGAVVVTSAGGKAVSAADGSFTLELCAPLAARRLHLTAFAGPGGSSGTLLATAVLEAPFDDVAVGELVLELGMGCEPDWIPTFGEKPGLRGYVYALAVFDDGGGPALFVGGDFSEAGSTESSHLAKWDGARWSDPGAALNGGVFDLLVHDDGSGPALFVAGVFSSAGGIDVGRIARWDGTSWSALAGGAASTSVRCMAVFDDGSGPALYAGGLFTTIGGQPAARIAKWDGASWSPLAGGVNSAVHALCAYEVGGVEALYVGGSFTQANGLPIAHIARWDGASWSAVAGGASARVRCLALHGSGAAQRLVAGGDFTSIGGVGANRVAAWDGTQWESLGSGVDQPVHALHSRMEAGGSQLYAGGEFHNAGGVSTPGLARWDGASWWAVGAGAEGDVYAFEEWPGSGAAELHAGGAFTFSGAVPVNGIARWDGAGWHPLGNSFDREVGSLCVLPGAGGERLVAGGYFRGAAGLGLASIGRWDAGGWSALGEGVAHSAPPWVEALAVQDVGHGLELFLGGDFGRAGDVDTRSIASWRSEGFAALGPGVAGPKPWVHALFGHDDGSGPSLFVGGSFVTSGGLNLWHIGRWDGENWWWIETGTDRPVRSFARFDDGSGPALYVGGDFDQVGTVAASRIAKWDGTAWSPLGAGVCCGGLYTSVHAMVVHDDGSGPALYAGGWFESAGGIPGITGIARWDGSTWSAVGGAPDGPIHALAVYDDGSGAALYAAGHFTSIAGVAARGVAKWDGQSWMPLGAGVEGDYPGGIEALAVFDSGDGPDLYLGGWFDRSPGGDSFLGRFGGCGGVGSAYCFGAEDACPCGNAGAAGEGCANSSGAGAVIRGSGSASLALDNLSVVAEHLPAGRAVLLFSGTNAPNGGHGLPFGDGLLCAGGNQRRLELRFASDLGTASFGPGLATRCGYPAGTTARFQAWYRDPQGSPCGLRYNLSHGLAIVLAP